MLLIKKFVEQETLNRRDLLLASTAGLGSAAVVGVMGAGVAQAALKDPTIK